MNCRLLIVDDRPENLQAIEAILGRQFELTSALSGRTALELLGEQDFDLVLLDTEMPFMDGYETARRIRQMERCRELPIVFMSAVFVDDPYIKRGYENGALDYMTKPFDPAVLRKKVALYASLRQKDALIREQAERIRDLEGHLPATPELTL